MQSGSAPGQHPFRNRSDGRRREDAGLGHVGGHQAGGDTLEVSSRYRLPLRLTRDRRGRSARTIPVPVVSRIRLRPGVPRADIETTVDNRAEDHRLRALFPTPFRTDHALAEGQLDVVARPIALPADTRDYVEQPVPTAPQCGFVAVREGGRGLLLANRGLPEYEVMPGGDGVTPPSRCSVVSAGCRATTWNAGRAMPGRACRRRVRSARASTPLPTRSFPSMEKSTWPSTRPTPFDRPCAASLPRPGTVAWPRD